MMKGSYKTKKVKISPTILVSIFLLCSLLFITIGFSALSTTFSLDGSVSFVPVGMIRVMSITPDNLNNATDISSSIMPDSIRNTIDLNSINSTASYNVTIKNLGQIDYYLDNIEELLFSNNQADYVISGYQIGNVIHAKEEVTLKITFKFKEGTSSITDNRINSQLKFNFKEYVDTSQFPVVFSHEDRCIFNGTENISGYDCLEYWNKNYIDTGIALYNEANYQKDYEIGFTVEEYTPSVQVQQAVFMNSKYENANAKYPGIVFRKSTNNTIEITQTINNGTKAASTVDNYTLPMDVRIFRIDGIVYYSINGGTMIQLQNMTSFNNRFNTTAWFGAADDGSGNPFRPLKGTLSNMYIKLGTYQAERVTLTFDPREGSLSNNTMTVDKYIPVGELPVPTPANAMHFEGWYTSLDYSTQVTSASAFNKDTTLYAKWSIPNPVEMNGSYYSSIMEAINTLTDNNETVTIKLYSSISEKVDIPAKRNIIFDFGEYTLSNPGTDYIIENSGNLRIISGTIRTNGTSAAVNNTKTGTMSIEGGTIISTGAKQALYNDGGTVTISGGAYFNNVSTIRAAVHNLNNGTMTILDATIISQNLDGVNNASGTLIIGSKDGTISNTKPYIQGKNYGINSSVNYSLYDGIVKGQTGSVNNRNRITNIETNSSIVTTTEVLNDKTYNVLYLQ